MGHMCPSFCWHYNTAVPAKGSWYRSLRPVRLNVLDEPSSFCLHVTSSEVSRGRTQRRWLSLASGMFNTDEIGPHRTQTAPALIQLQACHPPTLSTCPVADFETSRVPATR